MGNVFEILHSSKLIRPSYFDDRLSFELCENIHLHYRNLRLELSGDEFCDLYRAFRNGFKRFQEYVLSNSVISIIPLEEICPFDDFHKKVGDFFDCGEEQEDHLEGIKYVKSLIDKGIEIRPIVVVPDEIVHQLNLKINRVRQGYDLKKFFRADGFKRYWAFKELGKTEITCYVLKEYIAGIQEGLSLSTYGDEK